MKKLMLLLCLFAPGCVTTMDVRPTCIAYEPGGTIWLSPISTLDVTEVRIQPNSIIYHGQINVFGIPTAEIANYEGPLCR
jgi:hypothetical protein